MTNAQFLPQQREQNTKTLMLKNAALLDLRKDSNEVAESGVQALDLIDSPPLTTATLTKAVGLLQANYGVTYSEEKIALLWDVFHREGWSEERFMRTLLWFITHKLFPSWTVADWYAHPGIKLYPRAPKGKLNIDFWKWKLPDGTIAYSDAYADLPFERITATLVADVAIAECRDCGVTLTLAQFAKHECQK